MIVHKELYTIDEIKEYLEKEHPEFENISKKIDDALKGIREDISKRISETIASFVKELLQGMFHLFVAGVETYGYVIAWFDIYKRLGLYKAFETHPIELLDFSTLATEYFKGNISIDSVYSEMAKRGYNKERVDTMLSAFQQLMNLEDIRRAYIQQEISGEEALKKIKQLGYTDEDAKTILKVTRSFLSVSDYVTSWLREYIDDNILEYYLKAHGYQSEDIELIKRLAFTIPPVSDLIRMAVREVFSPVLRQKYTLDEDFPEEFAYWAKKAGLSEVWARAYWAAHWDLPSMTQGYEMLHRLHPDLISWKSQALRNMGIEPSNVATDLDTLRELARMQDIAPYWRDRLIAISYAPLTRVDIRRMYKLGVLTEDDVYFCYRELGYDDVNARRLTEFTKIEAIESERDLSKSEIMDAVEAGLMTIEEAKTYLKRLKFNDSDIEIFLALALYKREKKLRDAEINAIKKQYLNNKIDRITAQRKLIELALTGAEVDNYLETWDREKASKALTLSDSNIQKAYKFGIITKQEALDMLMRKGYNSRDAEIILELARRETGRG